MQALLGNIPGVQLVRKMPGTDLVEFLHTREAIAKPVQASVAPPQANAVVSPDQWNLFMVNLPDAWNMIPGGIDQRPWKNIRIGHIDTGYTEHEVFGPWVNGVSPNIRAELGLNLVDENSSVPRDPLDYNSGNPGHGTRTSSILAGNGADNFFGAAPGVTVVPYRYTNSVVINQGNLDQVIRHAVIDSGCQVITISLGDPCFPLSKVGRALDDAYERGVIFVAAAGNITSEVVYPARYSRTLAIGGVTRDNLPWTGSSRGSYVDICAPADEVPYATTQLRNGQLDFGYGTGDGTSYATVHVSGTAALWLAFHGKNLNIYNGWQRVEAFRILLRQSALVPADWDINLYGAGILDAARLLSLPLPDPSELQKDSPAGIGAAR